MSEPTSILTRDFFVNYLHSNPNIGGSKAQIRETLDAFLVGVIAGLRAGHTVHFKGLGRFSVIETAARPGRNPKTGEPSIIPAGRRVRFKPSKKLLPGGDEEAAE